MTNIRTSALALLTALAAGVLYAPGAQAATGGLPGKESVAVKQCGVVPPLTPDDGATTAAPEVFEQDTQATAALVRDNKVLVYTQSEVKTYASSGQLLSSISAPGTTRDFGADSSGAVYTLAPEGLQKHDAQGTLVWNRPLSMRRDTVQGWDSPSGFRLYVGLAGTDSSIVFDSDGSQLGTSSIIGGRGSTAPDGTLTTTDGHYVYRWGKDGQLLTKFGTSAAVPTLPTGAPFVFARAEGVATDSNGTTFITDSAVGIVILGSDGMLVGIVPKAQLVIIADNSPIFALGDRVYYSSGAPFRGNAKLMSVSKADLYRMAARATTSSYNLAQPLRRLGLGAGLGTGTPDSYIPAGTTGTVHATFDPWWQAVAGKYVLRVERSSWRTVLANGTGTVTATPLTAEVLSKGVDLPVPSTPGPVQYDARLIRLSDGIAMSATCLVVAVGAPGNQLDLSTLPSGGDYGGPAPVRHIALADILGVGLARTGVDWRSLVKADGTLNFTSIDSRLNGVAEESAKRGVPLIMEMGEGGQERDYVYDSRWSSYVRQVVAHLKDRIHYWEPWNEPNATFGSASDYVARVLKPFYAAVKASDPTAQVVGGTVVGMDMNYWNRIILDGGLQAMDIAAIHPYTGHNRGFDEQGTPAQLAYLRRQLDNFGAKDMKIWDTESSWWSAGAYNYWTQSDKTIQGMLWERASGIDRWDYFTPEGGFDGPQSYSAIQINDVVKPSGLALMAAKTRLQGRSFVKMVDTGTPDTFAMEYGRSSTDSGHVLAVFTDELTVPMVVTGTGSGTSTSYDEYGAPAPLPLTGEPLAFAASGAVHYFTVPEGATVTLAPEEAFTLNALQGATATASSSRKGSNPASAVDGDDTTANQNDWASTAWYSDAGDAAPVWTAHLKDIATLDRVQIVTHSVGSVAPGNRDFRVQVRASDSSPWMQVATVKGEYYERSQLVTFPTQPVSDVRVLVDTVNYTGYNEGRLPSDWNRESDSINPQSLFYGPATLMEVRAFSPGFKVLPTAPLVVVADQTLIQPLTHPTAVIYGRAAALATRLLSSIGSPLAARQVQLWARPSHVSGADWSAGGTVTTDSTGRAGWSVLPRRNTDYVARFAGERDRTASASAMASVSVVPLVTRRLTVTSVHRNHAARISGSVSPSTGGVVLLQKHLPGMPWTNVASMRLTSGSYGRALSTGSMGTADYRVVTKKSSSYAAAASSYVTLKITG